VSTVKAYLPLTSSQTGDREIAAHGRSQSLSVIARVRGRRVSNRANLPRVNSSDTAFEDLSTAESYGHPYAPRKRTVRSGRSTGRTSTLMRQPPRPRDGEVVLRLQVHPHLSGCSKIAGQS